MRSFVGLITCLLVCSGLISCSFDPAEIENFVDEFVVALQGPEAELNPGDPALVALYPDIAELGIPAGPGEKGILEIKKQGGSFEVEMINKRTGENEYFFLVGRDREGNLIIKDSKGLLKDEMLDWVPFAVRTGCLEKDADLTDLKKARAISMAKIVFDEQYQKEEALLNSKLEVLDWSWKPDKSSGTVRIKNNTGIEIQGLYCKLNLLDREDHTLKIIEKHITNDLIENGDIFEGQVNLEEPFENAGAKIQVTGHPDFLKRVVKYKEYSGKECENK